MEDSCGPRKRKRASADADIEIPGSSKDAEENSENVLLPHLVVEKILEYLDFKDLLVCSSVNKFWNHEARRLLRKKRQCALIVDLDKKSAKELVELQATLAAGELPLPYGSLSIKKKGECADQQGLMWSDHERAQLAMSNIILRAGPFKVVQLDVKCGLGTSFETHMIRSVMTAVQKTVKVLMIKNLDGSDLLMNTKKLPELKKLEINLEAAVQERDMESIQNFIKYSEKLETFGCMSSKWIQLLKKLPPARKLAIVKEFSCVRMRMDMSQEVAAFAELEPKLQKLFIPRNPRYRSYQLDPTNAMSMSLLLSSQASLIELQAPYEMLQEVRREKPLASFMNLRYLTVYLPLGTRREELDRSGIIIALCPKLEKLKINTEPSRRFGRLLNDLCARMREQQYELERLLRQVHLIKSNLLHLHDA